MDRQELIDICIKAVVPVDRWTDRDSASAQSQLGTAHALLGAGCDYDIAPLRPGDRTIWVTVYYPGFNAFEYGRDERANWESEAFYLPTVARLEQAAGGDWY